MNDLQALPAYGIVITSPFSPSSDPTQASRIELLRARSPVSPAADIRLFFLIGAMGALPVRVESHFDGFGFANGYLVNDDFHVFMRTFCTDCPVAVMQGEDKPEPVDSVLTRLCAGKVIE